MIPIDTLAPDRPLAMPVPVVAWLVAAIMIVALLAMLQGQFSVVHEFVHDARHFTGVPCH